jgi:hypothetical protein
VMRVALHALRMLTRSRADQLDTSHANCWLQEPVHRLSISVNLLYIVCMRIVNRPNKTMTAAKTMFICFYLDPEFIHHIMRLCAAATRGENWECACIHTKDLPRVRRGSQVTRLLRELFRGRTGKSTTERSVVLDVEGNQGIRKDTFKVERVRDSIIARVMVASPQPAYINGVTLH